MGFPYNKGQGMQGEILAFLQANPYAYACQDVGLCLGYDKRKASHALFKLAVKREIVQKFVGRHTAVYAAREEDLNKAPPAHQMAPRPALSKSRDATSKREKYRAARAENTKWFFESEESIQFHSELIGTQPPPLDLVTLFIRNGMYP